ncbi:LamG-like jellyroll fold domain-containing protein [Amycolatopsis thailandensis]|uniref:LamG-like jellyroll fold domain-containing protein n=1 Tax=Amycolatopsis thailandensis TaxID=589330 RepID=UPI001FC9BD1D|nr:LamG-like jellyroll fold domain-containing protein [Amycolatopsis thailandensis]
MLPTLSPPRPRKPKRFRKTLATAVAVASALALTSGAATAAESGWKMGKPRLTTPWTNQVSPTNALPEYPRPQLVRENWQNLNGVWEFAGAAPGEVPPFGEKLAEKILVPYPAESALSGIQRHEDYMWYRRTFTVPKNWNVGRDNTLRINFGAVDYKAKVYVNGKEVAAHQGGYGAFSADVTSALKPKGEQEIIVGVEDRADATWQPVGKQRLVPDRGIFYEGASGIWQTVWMEPVAAKHVGTLGMVPDLKSSTLKLTVDTGGSSGLTVEAVVRDGRKVVSRSKASAAGTISLPVPKAKLWSPDSPFLYDLDVELKDGRRTVDKVSSYFGMREYGTTKGADGKLRFTLNGKILFLQSTLDQGYWPDGIYTAPTDQALRFDLEQHKVLGFNTVRKHIKTEPDRWYHHADKLGLLVWQDMPSMRTGGRPPVDAQQQFKAELKELVEQKKNWTSIVGYVPFNEGWAEWSREETGKVAESVKAQDPTRLVNAHSGVNCCDSLGDSGKGDVLDWHSYPGPAKPMPDAKRISIDGEHGGYGLEVKDHMWFGEGHAYEMVKDQATLNSRYVQNQRDVLASAQSCGISGSIYTQITDVEHEVNGFFTYDRQVKKMDFAQVRAVNQAIIRNADGSGSGAPDPGPGTPGITGVHAYKFDEGTGSSAADSVGTANATLTNTQWAGGVEGGALAFAGNGQADTGANLVNTAGSYSVSAWAKLDEAGGAFQTVVSQDTGRDSAFFLQYSGQDQRWAMSFVGLRALSPEKPQVGKWYHLTGVRDAKTGTLSLYVDGTKVASQNACSAAPSTGHTVIGRGQYGGQQVDFLRGAVDDVRFYDRPLSDAEVATLAKRD